VCQAHRGALLAGILVCRLAPLALKVAPGVGSYSVVQCVRRLMGQPLYCSAADASVWGERGYGDGSTLYGEENPRDGEAWWAAVYGAA